MRKGFNLEAPFVLSFRRVSFFFLILLHISLFFLFFVQTSECARFSHNIRVTHYIDGRAPTPILSNLQQVTPEQIPQNATPPFPTPSASPSLPISTHGTNTLNTINNFESPFSSSSSSIVELETSPSTLPPQSIDLLVKSVVDRLEEDSTIGIIQQQEEFYVYTNNEGDPSIQLTGESPIVEDDYRDQDSHWDPIPYEIDYNSEDNNPTEEAFELPNFEGLTEEVGSGILDGEEVLYHDCDNFQEEDRHIGDPAYEFHLENDHALKRDPELDYHGEIVPESAEEEVFSEQPEETMEGGGDYGVFSYEEETDYEREEPLDIQYDRVFATDEEYQEYLREEERARETIVAEDPQEEASVEQVDPEVKVTVDSGWVEPEQEEQTNSEDDWVVVVAVVGGFTPIPDREEKTGDEEVSILPIDGDIGVSEDRTGISPDSSSVPSSTSTQGEVTSEAEQKQEPERNEDHLSEEEKARIPHENINMFGRGGGSFRGGFGGYRHYRQSTLSPPSPLPSPPTPPSEVSSIRSTQTPRPTVSMKITEW